jgi:hypothetical protein
LKSPGHRIQRAQATPTKPRPGRQQKLANEQASKKGSER